MSSRTNLQTLLEELLGSRNVYFQPPASINMRYPAIVYSRKTIDNVHANNSAYVQHEAYELTLIDEDPDSELVKKVSLLPTCSFDRYFTSDNLNHYTFTLYFKKEDNLNV